jgi:tetratricopeptide (TPR) repeat protein
MSVRPRSRWRDTRDDAELAFMLRAFTWSLTALVIGAGLGIQIVLRTDRSAWIIPALALGCWAVAFFGTLAFASLSGRIGSSLYFSSGSSTPGRREYSLAQSYVARGRFDAAVAEYERAAAAHAADAEPCLRLARLHRDQLHRPEDAAHWFRQALTRPHDAGTAILILRELAELYTHRLNSPQRALPPLAQLVHRFPDSAAAAWARSEMADIRRVLPEETGHG